MRHLTAALSLLGLMAPLAACNEPVVFDPNANNEPGPDPGPDNEPEGNPDPGDAGDPPDTSPPRDVGEGMIVIEPDRDFFVEVIRPISIQGCAQNTICHPDNGANSRRFLISTTSSPDDATIDKDLRNMVNFIDYDDPAQSSLLLKGSADFTCCGTHPLIWSPTGEDYRMVSRWISESVKVVFPGDDQDVGTPDGGGDDDPVAQLVPCEALPNPNALPGIYSFDAYQSQVNNMLVDRCTRAGGCHAVPGNGGGLWLLRQDDLCSVTQNFLVVRWFVEPSQANILSSPILTQPLGQQEQNQLHGGSVVFQGQDDCGYVLLKLWLEDSLEQLPQECR